MNCCNCEFKTSGNYCSNCGQASLQKRFTLSHLNDLVLDVFNLKEGFFYTLKTLTFEPKRVLMDYIIGRRKPYMNPAKFVVILVTLKIVIFNFFYTESDGVEILLMNKTYWTPLILIVFVVVFTLVSFYGLKGNFNIIENIIINLYLFGMIEFLSILTALLKVSVSLLNINSVVSIFAILTQVLIIFYVYKTIFKKRYIATILVSLISWFLFYFFLWVIFRLIGYSFL